MKYKQVRLGDLKDNKSFKLSPKSSVWYTTQRKSGNCTIFTSVSSGRTFERHNDEIVYIQTK